MIDIHSHLLYGIDDGSKSIEESISIISKLNKIGVKDIILTPHYINGSSYISSRKNNLQLMSNLKEELKKKNIDTNLYLGNEIYIDKDIKELIKKGEISPLNNTKYLLVELPMSGEKEDYIDIFLDLIEAGYTVILAHPERYISIQNNYSLIYEILEIGVLLQANIGSILGDYGKSSKKTLKKLLKDDFITFFGTDIHHEKKDYAFLDKAKSKLKKYTDEDKMNKLLYENAIALIQDND